MATPSSVRRPFALLCLDHVFIWSTLFLGVFLGPFAAREMTGSFALSGLPFAMYFLANLLVLVPAAWLMDRIGRTPVLALGHLAGVGGAFSVAAGLTARAAGSVVAIPTFLGGLFLRSPRARRSLEIGSRKLPWEHRPLTVEHKEPRARP